VLIPKIFPSWLEITLDMSGKTCAVCGKALEPNEIRINERSTRPGARKSRYLCFNCRRKEYNNYQDSIRKLIEKM